MCLSLPYKVSSIKKRQIELKLFGRKYKVEGSLVKVRPGDFVLVQKNIIIKKVPKKEAKRILGFILNQ
jgi:hydrogenase maturation factor